MPLETVSLEALHATLADVEGKKPTQRLLLAILYKQGPSVPMIADWFDMRAETIYRWFRLMDTAPLDEAVYDAPKPGRPPALSSAERARFQRAISKPPKQEGYDTPDWSPQLAQSFLQDVFGVEYSLRHVRRLLESAGADFEAARTGVD